MRCYQDNCSFTGNPTEAKNHTELTNHETGNEYIRFKPSVATGIAVKEAAPQEAKPSEGAKA